MKGKGGAKASRYNQTCSCSSSRSKARCLIPTRQVCNFTRLSILDVSSPSACRATSCALCSYVVRARFTVTLRVMVRLGYGLGLGQGVCVLPLSSHCRCDASVEMLCAHFVVSLIYPPVVRTIK